MLRRIAGCLALGLALPSAEAGPRASASYAVATEITDGGGRRTASARYTNDGSAGTVAGIATVAAPAQSAKSGYAGQLYEIAGLALTSAPATVNEAATLQLAAWQVTDDATFLAVPGGAVAWSIVGGPIAGIDASGLATAQTVYQNTPATVQGAFGGWSGTLTFTVVNVTSDDFGPYANDGLPDDWQVQYFGPANASGKGGPDDDFDGTGQTNLFKYVAGLNPTDPNSRFGLSIEPASGPATHAVIRFTPVVGGRSYTVKSSPSLTAPDWQPLISPTQSDDGNTRTVTDASAAGSANFYRVEILKP